MRLFGRFYNFEIVILAVLLIAAAVSCQSQAVASGGAEPAAGSGEIVVTGDIAGKILDLNFDDPSQPIPFTLSADSNIPACKMEYINGKLRVTSQILTERPWIVTNPFLGRELGDFFWQFEFTPNRHDWNSIMLVFRATNGSMNEAYHIHILGQNSLDLRDKNSNLAQNNDSIQVHSIYGGTIVNGAYQNDRKNIASTRFNWWGPGRPAMFRVVAEDDNCKIWIWRKGSALPAKPTFEFTMSIPELYKGDFLIVGWEADFMLDDMVIFNRAKP